MNKKILIIASVLGLLSIAFGAFGAHGLKTLISSEALQTFETGIKYQMYHALMLLFVGSTAIIQQKTKKILCYLIVLGILLFFSLSTPVHAQLKSESLKHELSKAKEDSVKIKLMLDLCWELKSNE